MAINLGKQVVALDMGSYSIKMIVGTWNGDRIKISSFHECLLNNDVYENGTILNEENLRVTMMDFLKQQKITVKNVVLSIESSEIIKREMEVDKVDDADQDGLIKYEITQYLPIDLGKYVVQHKVIEEYQLNEFTKLKINLGAVPKDMIESHYKFLKSCNLNPLVLDLSSNAIEKLLNLCLPSEEILQNTVALINLGHRYTDVGVYEKGKFCFNRLIRMGGNGVTQSIMTHMNLRLDEALQYKDKLDLKAIYERYSDSMNTYEQDDFLQEEIFDHYKETFNEVLKIVNYYKARALNNEINHIYLYGGTSNLKNISELAEETLGIRTTLLDNLNNLEVNLKFGNLDSRRFAVCLGTMIKF